MLGIRQRHLRPQIELLLFSVGGLCNLGGADLERARDAEPAPRIVRPEVATAHLFHGGIVRRRTDERCNVFDACLRRLASIETRHILEIWIEAEGAKTAAEGPPDLIDAAAAADIDQGEAVAAEPIRQQLKE